MAEVFVELTIEPSKPVFKLRLASDAGKATQSSKIFNSAVEAVLNTTGVNSNSNGAIRYAKHCTPLNRAAFEEAYASAGDTCDHECGVVENPHTIWFKIAMEEDTVSKAALEEDMILYLDNCLLLERGQKRKRTARSNTQKSGLPFNAQMVEEYKKLIALETLWLLGQCPHNMKKKLTEKVCPTLAVRRLCYDQPLFEVPNGYVDQDHIATVLYDPLSITAFNLMIDEVYDVPKFKSLSKMQQTLGATISRYLLTANLTTPSQEPALSPEATVILQSVVDTRNVAALGPAPAVNSELAVSAAPTDPPANPASVPISPANPASAATSSRSPATNQANPASVPDLQDQPSSPLSASGASLQPSEPAPGPEAAGPVVVQPVQEAGAAGPLVVPPDQGTVSSKARDPGSPASVPALRADQASELKQRQISVAPRTPAAFLQTLQAPSTLGPASAVNIESSVPTTPGGTCLQLDGEEFFMKNYRVIEANLLAVTSALAEARIREQEWKKLFESMKEKSERCLREAETTKIQAGENVRGDWGRLDLYLVDVLVFSDIVHRLRRLYKDRGTDGHHTNQAAYRLRSSTLDHLVVVQAASTQSSSTSRELVLISYDVQKAFDSVCRFFAAHCVRNHLAEGAPKLSNLISRFLLAPMTAHYGGQQFPVHTGVPQGGILSPEVFLMCMDPLPARLDNHPGFEVYAGGEFSNTVFADDILSFSRSKADATLIAPETLIRRKENFDFSTTLIGSW